MRMRRMGVAALLCSFWFASCVCVLAQSRVVLERGKSTIVLEPYAPNIIRVTLSMLREPALARPGYGFIAQPSAEGWSHEPGEAGDVYRSPRLVVTVAGEHRGKPGELPQTIVDISKFFNGSTPGAHITVDTPQGKRLVELQGWSMS